MCEITGKKPQFYAYCPYFTLSVSRDRAAHENDTNSQENRTRLLQLWTFMLVFIVLLSPLLALIGRASVFVIVGILLLGYSIYTWTMSNKTNNLPLFAYTFIVFVSFLEKYKKYGDSDKQIIYQTLIRLYGNDVAQRAMELYEKGFALNARALKRLLRLTSRWDRRFLYTLLFQLFVYDNVKALDSDNIMLQLTSLFGIKSDEYLRLKEIYISREYRHKSEQYKQHRQTNFSETNLNRQFEILGLRQSASNDEIKRRFRQLAKMYHPDHQHNPEMAQEAQEQFRLILAAYEQIKKARGIK